MTEKLKRNLIPAVRAKRDHNTASAMKRREVFFIIEVGRVFRLDIG
jgi:hypothetical protein